MECEHDGEESHGVEFRNNSGRCYSLSTFLAWIQDIVDKNLRPSYACLDRINFLSLSDVKGSNSCIDVYTLLIGEADLDGLNSDVEVLLERYVVTQHY